MSGDKKPTSPSSGYGGTPADCTTTPCQEKNSPTKAGSKILLNGTPEEKRKLQAILDKIRETKSGQKLLADIDKAKNTVEFQLGEAKKSGGGVTKFTGGLNGPVSNWAGTKSTVILDQDLKDDSLYVFDKDGNKIADPIDVVAAHELTHALHCSNGTIDTSDPERQAISGENGIRNERTPSLPDRDPGNHNGGYN